MVGLHPIHTISQEVDEEESHFVSREEKFDYEFYRKLAQDPLVVGIGECGLDYYRVPDGMGLGQVKEIQRNAFLQQIKLAKELDKALVIHCRPSKDLETKKDSTDAYEDILEILRGELSTNGVSGTNSLRFEIHSFTSNWQIARQFLELGGYIGMNGIITFDKSGVLREVATNVPLEKIVLETDAPYLAPGPFRGKRCLPEYVKYTAEFVAEVKGISVDQVAVQTTKNAKALFII